VVEASDLALTTRLKRGERAAFQEVYERFRTRVYAFLLRLSGRRDTADDLFQETWLKLARHARRLRDDTDLAAWIFTVARNEFRSHRRWALLDLSRLVVLEEAAPYARLLVDAEGDADAVRAARRLEVALAALSPEHREAILLVGVEGFDQDRAAEIAGVRYDAFRKRLERARAELDRALSRSEALGASARRGAT
jgi:RNA polymerase sigma-70 factor, ECF subfamily